MSIPSPSLTIPTLALYQLSYKGLAMAGVDPTQPYALVKLEGLDNPETNSSDAQRSLDSGEFPGYDTSKGRDVTLEQTVKANATSLDNARQDLENVMKVAGNIEVPLYVKLPSGLFACMARPRKHKGPAIDLLTVQAKGGIATSMWHATDPKLYAMPTRSQSVGLPENLSGLSFGGPGSGVSFGGAGSGVSFGGGAAGGLLNVHNNGNAECRPTLIFTGPCINPVASNLSLPGAPSIGFTITLGAGDTLEVDMDLGRVLLRTAGTSGPASRREAVMAGSTWWTLEPEDQEAGTTGLNVIEFTTADAAKVSGMLTVISADAYLGL